MFLLALLPHVSHQQDTYSNSVFTAVTSSREDSQLEKDLGLLSTLELHLKESGESETNREVQAQIEEYREKVKGGTPLTHNEKKIIIKFTFLGIKVTITIE